MKLKLPWAKKENPAWGTILKMVASRDAVWTEKRYDLLSRAGYQNCITFFACVLQIMKAAGPVEWILQRRKGKRVDELDEHPLLDLLHRPNPDETKIMFIENMLGYLLCSGNSFTIKNTIGNRPPMEIYNLRPDRVKVLPGDRNQFVRGYRYMAGGAYQDFEKFDVMHLKEFHPTNDWYGLSRLEVAARAVDISNKSMEWNKKLLDNDMRPSGNLSFEGSLTEGQIDSIRKQLREQLQGYEHAGEFFVTGGGAKWMQMSMTGKDMDWLNSDKVTARRICSVLNVAPELIGDSENKTYSNYQEARRALYEETVIPLLLFIASGFNLWLCPLYGPDLYLDINRDAIDALQEEAGKKYVYLQGASWLTIDEKRVATGYEKLGPEKGGDLVLVPMGMMSLKDVGLASTTLEDDLKKYPVPTGGMVKGPGAIIAGAEPVIPLKKLGDMNVTVEMRSIKTGWKNPARKLLLWENFVLRVKAKERPLVGVATKYLLGQRGRARKEAEALGALTLEAAAGVLDEEQEAKAWEKASKGIYFSMFKKAGAAGMKVSKGGLFVPEEKDDLFEFWAEHESEILTMILESGAKICKSSLKIIADLVELGSMSGWTPKELSYQIGLKLDEFAGYRARRIARTETAKIENYGVLEGYKETDGIDGKGWMCAFVEFSREAHVAADEQEVRLDEYFVVDGESLKHPGDPSGSPGNIINCLCSTYPVSFGGGS